MKSARTRLSRLLPDQNLDDLGIVHQEISPAEHRLSVNRRHVLVTQGLEGLVAARRRAVDEVFDRLKARCSRLIQETAARIREMDAEGASLARAVREDARRVFGSTVRDVWGDPA